MMRWIAPTIVAAALALPQRLDAQLPVQGVKVHGHWVIEVRNADGTLHERREFENALHKDGSLLLAGLLIRAPALNGLTGTFWGVVLRLSPTSSNLCASGTPTQVVCVTESGHPGTAGHLFKNLNLDATTGAFVLKGSAVLANAGTIVTVGTTVGTEQVELQFTSTDLASPISVEATQTVSVTVTISFS